MAVAHEGLNTAAALRPQKDARARVAVMENELKTVAASGHSRDRLNELSGGAVK